MPALLELDRVTTGYGKVEVLHELSVSVPQGSVVALLPVPFEVEPHAPNAPDDTTIASALA